MNDQVPFVSQPAEPAPERAAAAAPAMIGGGETEAREKAHFQEVKAKALEDKKIQELQDKADSAGDDAAQRKASKEYYKALYARMRKLDPALKERIERLESATMQRLDRAGGGKPDEAQ